MNEKFAHTAGPWSFYTEPQPNGCPIVGDDKGLMVAMLAHTVNQSDQKEVALANARLISTSPKMFEALHAAEAGLEVAIARLEADKPEGYPVNVTSEYLALKIVRAAIAQALGKISGAA